MGRLLDTRPASRRFWKFLHALRPCRFPLAAVSLRRLARWTRVLVLTGLVVACAPAGGYDVRAVVLESDGAAAAAPGDLLASGAQIRVNGPGRATLGLMPGTVVALDSGGELQLQRLRLQKEGSRMLGREVDLLLMAGELDLLIAAPEEAAPTTLRLRTIAGEIVAGPGCLARVRLEASVVHVLCARGELWCAGERLPAGNMFTFPPVASPRPAAADPSGQRGLLSLLERGARMQTLDLDRQARAPAWRSVSR